MSSPIDKKFGDLFIHGVHPDGRVELEFSSHSKQFNVGLIPEASAQQMILAWNSLKDEAERLSKYEWMYKDLSE